MLIYLYFPILMSKICLNCNENETAEMTAHNICDQCYDNAGRFLEENVLLIKAVPDLLDACRNAWDALNQCPMKRLNNDRTSYDVAADLGRLLRQLDRRGPGAA
jgi:hypothetical protein